MTPRRIVLFVFAFLALGASGFAEEAALPSAVTLGPEPLLQVPAAGALSPVTPACQRGEPTLAEALGVQEASGMPCNNVNCPPPLYYCCGPDWRTGCCAW